MKTTIRKIKYILQLFVLVLFLSPTIIKGADSIQRNNTYASSLKVNFAQNEHSTNISRYAKFGKYVHDEILADDLFDNFEEEDDKDENDPHASLIVKKNIEGFVYACASQRLRIHLEHTGICAYLLNKQCYYNSPDLEFIRALRI